MIDWQDRINEYGAEIIVDGLIINNDADKEGIEKCRQIGELLAKS